MATMQQILEGLYNVTVDDLKPLRDVKTAKDLKKLNDAGYPAGYTVDEWKKEYPKIDADNVYYVSAMTGGMAYYDGFVFLQLHIYGKQSLMGSAEELQERVAGSIRTQTNALAKKEYLALVISAPDGICANILNNILEKDGPSPKFYDAFVTCYQMKNCNTSVYGGNIWEKLLAMKDDEQKAKTKEYLDRDFPTGVATIYRGWGKNSVAPAEAASWSADINAAAWMSTIRGANPVLTTGKVKCEDIIEYTPHDSDDGGEAEIIIRPGSVYDVQNTPLYDSESPEMLRLVNSVAEMYNQYKYLVMKLYQDKPEYGHGAKHSCRVLMYSLVLGCMLNVSAEDMVRLAEAAAYHDIGRVTDGSYDGHGKASAAIYIKNGGDDVVPFLLIKAHSIDDKEGIELIAGRLEGEEKQKACRLLSILKDADALDRVRFGRCGENDSLDVKFLRNRESLRLVPFAYQCLKGIELPEGKNPYERYTKKDILRSLKQYFTF